MIGFCDASFVHLLWLRMYYLTAQCRLIVISLAVF